MRRIVAALILFVALPLGARTPVKPGDHVAVLRPTTDDDRVLRLVQTRLAIELQSLGIEAVAVRCTRANLTDACIADASYLVEILRGAATPSEAPQQAQATSPSSSVLTSAVGGRIDVYARIYDRAMNTVADCEVHEIGSRGVLVGAGGAAGTRGSGDASVIFYGPFLQYSKVRATARTAARELALKIANVNQID